jgi:nicotinate dehydrogenase subunit A
MPVMSLKINGRSHTVDVDPATPLLYVLSDDLALKGPKFGCGLGQCGACTVIVNGLEGLGTRERPHPVQQAFIDEQAAQCGFCLSGVILSAKALLDRNPRATDADLQQALNGVLCRCFTHARFMRAIKRYQRSRTNAAVQS